jgi:hypothetical protein
MPIKLDTSVSGVDSHGNVLGYTIARCTQCPYWHAFAWSVDDALRAGARHQDAVHPGDHSAARRLQRRHA